MTVNAAVPVITVTTNAWIGASATVTANGNVVVAAQDSFTLFTVAGSISVAGTAAVGAGIAVPIVTKTTHSWIGDGAHVTSLALLGHVTHSTVAAGEYLTAGTDTRFDPRGTLGGYPTPYPTPPAGGTGLQADGMTINLGYNHGFKSGQMVVYDAGGGAPIGGLVDGGSLLVAMPVSNTAIQLCTQRGPPLAPGSSEFSCASGHLITVMTLGGKMGENQRFVPTTQPGVPSDVSPRFTAQIRGGIELHRPALRHHGGCRRSGGRTAPEVAPPSADSWMARRTTS